MANNKGYKRSWKNYLLDPSYQLRFTFTMLAVAAGLMAPLGWWVSQKATTATEVALNQIDEIRCPEALTAVAPTPPPDSQPGIAPAGATEDVEDLLDESAPTDESGSEPALDEEPPPADDADAADDADTAEPADGEPVPRERRVIEVNIDDSEMPERPEEVVVVGAIQERPPSPEEIQASIAARDACRADIVARKDSVKGRNSLITMVMLVSGGVLLIGLGVYGIKTTHGVAGPLFKVGLYLKKLENNVYDTVYNLRKGDQLVEFYDHFKDAHEGVTSMQQEDRDRLKDAIKLAKDAGLAEKSEELAASIKELERLLAEKEESLVKKEA